jgi:MFS family permease
VSIPASDLQTRPGGLRAQPGWPAFFQAATLARLASEMFPVAVVLLVLERTGRPALAGAAVAATTLPSVVSGPLLGAWLDRTSRRRTALASNQVVLGASLLAILAAAGHAPGWVLLLLAALAGLTAPLATGGFTSMLPSLVPERLLPRANALEASSFNTAAIAGPALAGAVAAGPGPAAAVALEAGLCGLALLAIPRLPRVARVASRADASLAATVRQGLRHLARTPVLRGVTVATAVALGGLGLLTLALPFLAERLGAGRAGARRHPPARRPAAAAGRPRRPGAARAGDDDLAAGAVLPGGAGAGRARGRGRGAGVRGHVRDPAAMVAAGPARADLHHRGQPQGGRVRGRGRPGRSGRRVGRRRRRPGGGRRRPRARGPARHGHRRDPWVERPPAGRPTANAPGRPPS